MHTLFFILLFSFALVSAGLAQPQNAKSRKAKSANLFDEADALFGKHKAKPKNSAHDRYANQEVSYRQAQNTQSQARKNQNIEIENDETHRTQPHVVRTESVNNNESRRKLRRARGRKN